MTPTFRTQMDSGRRALLEHVATVRDAQVRELLERARIESADIVANARRQSGARVRAAVREERQRRDRVRQRANGDMQTAVRQLQYRHVQAVLERAMALLRRAVQELWLDTGQRRRWLDVVMAEANQRLSGSKWIVEHPENLDAAGLREAVREFLAQHSEMEIQFRDRADIEAGFRVRCNDVVIDATLAALFEIRHAVEGALLGSLMQLPGWPTSELPNETGDE